jgi:CheY-like chemotaxis protein
VIVIIFIAEDEKIIQRLYEIQLGRAGHTLHLAGDGDEAIRLLKRMESPPDLLLLDLGLPGADGKEVYQEACSRFGELPAIFCSGSTINTGTDEFFTGRTGIAVLTKPISVRTILETAQELLTPSDT